MHRLIIKVEVIGEIRTTLAVTHNRRTLRKKFLRSVLRLPILVCLMMKAIRSSETSVLTGATRRKISGKVILQMEKYQH
jgi:hypothetical protein